jgi:hypothetical protein
VDRDIAHTPLAAKNVQVAGVSDDEVAGLYAEGCVDGFLKGRGGHQFFWIKHYGDILDKLRIRFGLAFACIGWGLCTVWFSVRSVLCSMLVHASRFSRLSTGKGTSLGM